MSEFLKYTYKPFDVVTNENGDVGFIQEVSIIDGRMNYSVCWLVGNETKHAWFNHNELSKHCNLFIKMAQNQCHPMGNSRSDVEMLFRNI